MIVPSARLSVVVWGALATMTASCSLDPFDYHPLDASADRVDAPPGDLVTDVLDATIDVVAQADVVSEPGPDVTTDGAVDVGSDRAVDDTPDVAVDAVFDASEVAPDAVVDHSELPSDVAIDASLDHPDVAIDTSLDHSDVAIDVALDHSDVAIDAPLDVRGDIADAQDAVDAAAADAGPCGDVGVAATVDAGVSSECPPLPACASVVTVTPTGGAGTDASPFTGWETIPPGACRVEFPPGVYHVRRPVTVRSNLTIRCMSSTSPVIIRRDPAAMTADGGVWNNAIFQETLGDALSNVVIEGCTFDHEGQYVDYPDIMLSGNTGLGIGDRVNLYVQNNHFINLDVPGSAPVQLLTGTGPGRSACFVVRGNEFLSPRFGTRPNPTTYLPFAVVVEGGEHVLVQGNRTQNHYGFYVLNSFYPNASPLRDVQVVDNVLEHVKSEAVRVVARGDSFGRAGGACVVPSDPTIHGAFADLRVERNTISAEEPATIGRAGWVRLGAVPHYLGCAAGCSLIRPMYDISVADNTLRGVRYGITISHSDDPREACVAGYEAGAVVPYIARRVRVVNNTIDGLGASSGAPLIGADSTLLFAIRVRDLEVRGNRFLNYPQGAYLSGENLVVAGNTFERLNQGVGHFAAPSDGSLNIVGARDLRSDGTFTESRGVTVSCNTFTAPASTGVVSLSSVLVDRGVSDVTLSNNTVQGSRYDCAVRVETGDAGVTDAGILESETTRVPATIAARCP